MCFSTTFTYILLILVLPLEVYSVDLQELINLIRSNGITSHLSNQSKSTVSINGVNHEIYKYNRDLLTRADAYGSILDKFYIYVNCECATWTHDKVIEIIKILPNLFSSFSEHSSQDNIIKQENIPKLNTTLTELENFIDVLLNYVEINNHDLSIESDLLKSLFYLKLAINHIINTMDKLHDENLEIKSDLVVITDVLRKNYFVITRILSETLYSIRGFMALNCKCPPYSYNDKQYFEYLANQTGENSTDLSMLTDIIGSMKLKSTHYECEHKYIMFLNDVINIEQLFDGYQIIWITNVGNVNFKTILNGITTTLDIEFISWCQLYTFKTIMKLIFTEILKVYELAHEIPNDVYKKLKELYTKVLVNYTNMPVELKVCFLLLVTMDGNQEVSKTRKLIEAINSYMQIVNDISLYTSQSTFTPNHIGSSHTEIPKSVLEKLMSQLTDKYEVFKCFIRFLTFVQRENEKYFLPLNPFSTKSIKVENVLNSIMSNNKYEERDILTTSLTTGNFITNDCDYAKGLYTLCFNGFVKITDPIDISKWKDDCEKIFKEVQNEVANFISYFPNHPNSKYLQIIQPLIEILGIKLIKNGNSDSIKRLMYVVMTELNKYALASCYPLNDKLYTLTENIIIGNTELLLVYDEVKSKMDNLVSVPYIQIISLNYFYDFYKSKSSDFEEHCSNVITFNWKGEKFSIQQIYENVTSVVTSPFYQFSFIHYYAKFLMTLLFNESLKLFNSNEKMPDDMYDKLYSLVHSIYSVNLNCLHKMVSDIIKHMILSINFAHEDKAQKENFKKSKKEEINDLETQAGYHFESIGVFINLPSPGETSSQSTQSTEIDYKKICKKMGKIVYMAKFVDQLYLHIKNREALACIPSIESYENFVC